MPTKTLYRGFTITTPSGIDEHDKPYFAYQIYKANPLTSLSSGEQFDSADTALSCAKDFVDEHLATDALRRIGELMVEAGKKAKEDAHGST